MFYSVAIIMSGNCFAQPASDKDDLKKRSDHYIYQGKIDSAYAVLHQLINIAQGQQDNLTQKAYDAVLVSVPHIDQLMPGLLFSNDLLS